MEPGPGTAAGARRLRPLNAPAPIELRAERGVPTVVRRNARWRPVERVEDVWRIDDGWWRAAPVSRTYFRLALDGGDVVTLYHDHVGDGWWAQRY